MTARVRDARWSRTALALGLLFGSLPVAGRLFLGSWGFRGAEEVACICLIAAGYLYLRSRRAPPQVPDTASIMDLALQKAAAGRLDEGIDLLTTAIQLSPRVWQAFQYRGEMYLQLNSAEAALEDFTEALRLAPGERHLYLLRGHAYTFLGDESAARVDYENAAVGGTTIE